MISLELHSASSDDWLNCVLADFDSFLLDHAANERKASSMAMSMAAHYPDKETLVTEMIDLALEELTHYKQVIRLIHERGLKPGADEKDPYVNQLRVHINKGAEAYFLDRLLTAAVIEARGEERFSRVAAALDDQHLSSFYQALANSERGHHELFLRLAQMYFNQTEIQSRLDEWLAIENVVIKSIPVRSRLH